MRLKLLFFFVLFASFFNGYAFQKEKGYEQALDSAAAYAVSNATRSKAYLDVIKDPSEATLGNRIGEYFYLKAKLEYEEYDPAGSIQDFIKSVKYAEKYKDYEIAAKSAAELASKFYLQKKDSIATIYFEKAKKYHTENGDTYGLLDLMQFPAYAKYTNFEMEESIALISKDLQVYKDVEDDKSYYCFAIFLLTSNYLHLGNIEKAHEYNTIYKSMQGNEYIEPSYYLTYKNAISSCFAEYYFEDKNLDSVQYYLDAIAIKSGSKDFNLQKNLYDYYIKYYGLRNDPEMEMLYRDSLALFNTKVAENLVESSLDLTEDLTQSNLQLAEELARKEKRKNYFYLLIAGVVLLLILLLIYFRKIKRKESLLVTLKENFSNVKAKQAKLAVKNIELEEFLISVRKEIKRITSIESLAEQQRSINELYKNIHLKHTNFVNSDDHYKLISSINEPFFLKIEKDYPQLDNLDILICYYLFAGFKNKEIALFVDRSVRAIENKRYRIAKKLALDSGTNSLKDFLDNTFKV